MKKPVLEFYGLAVCFGAIVCFVFGSSNAGYSLIQVVNPGFTMNIRDFYNFQSNDDFWKYCNGDCDFGSRDDNKTRPSEDKLTKERMTAYAVALSTEQRRGMQTLVEMLIIMLIDVVAFSSHWVIAKRARLD